jgi:hypothetical protein
MAFSHARVFQLETPMVSSSARGFYQGKAER